MKPSRASVVMLAVSLLLTAAPAQAAEQSVDLGSRGRYESYRLPADTESVDLAQQYGGNCRFGRSWGYDLTGRELWVDDGCSGRFTVRTRDGDKSSGNGTAAVVAIAAIAGLALLAHHHGKDDDDRPDDNQPSYPSWGGNSIRGMNGLCLDISGGLRQGAPLIVFRCHGSDNQRFSWSRRGELRVGDYCVDVTSGDTRDGTPLIAFRCNGGRNQRWSARGGQIVSDLSGKCMDLQSGQARPGQPVIAWRCNGGANQNWSW